MKKRVVALFMSLTMTLSMVSMTAFAADFSDMPNDWSTPALKNAVANGIIQGDDTGKIRPADNLTRAEMATVVNKAFNAQKEAAIGSYVDVKTSDWFYTQMSKAVAMETFVGTGNKLNPSNNITREEVFVILARAFNIPKSNENKLNEFKDNKKVGSWARDEVAALVSAGYVDGTEGYLNPGDQITRAEFAQMMDNLVKTYLGAGLYSKDYVGNVVINQASALLQGSTIKGDLIIADGVGSGNTVLEDVDVTGRLVVRSGSVEVLGNSNIKDVVVGHDDVTLKGIYDQVNLVASNTTLTIEDANIKSIVVTGTNNKINVNRNSRVNEIVANGKGLEVNSTGTVDKVTAGKEATGVMLNGKEIKPGTSSEDKDEVTAGIVTYINNSGTRLELDGKVYELNSDTKLVDEKGKTLAIGNNDIASNLAKDDVVKDIKVTNGVITSLVKLDKSEISKVNTATKAVVKAEESKLETDIDAAQVLVNALASGTAKTDLQNRITAIEPELTELEKAEAAVVKAEGSKLQTDKDAAALLVSRLESGSEKTALQVRVTAITVIPVTEGNATNTGVKSMGTLTSTGIDEVTFVAGAKATRTFNSLDILFTAKNAGTAGNSMTMEFVSPAPAVNQDIIVARAGQAVKVSLGTNALGDINSTKEEVVAAINASSEVNSLIEGSIVANGTQLAAVQPVATFSGGTAGTAAVAGAKEVYELTITNGATATGTLRVTSPDITNAIGVNVIAGMTAEEVVQAIKTDNTTALAATDYTITYVGNKIIFTANNEGLVGSSGAPAATITNVKVQN